MTEIVRGATQYAVRFFEDFGAMLWDTRKFIEAESATEPTTLERPLLFLLTSIGLLAAALAASTTFTTATVAKLAAMAGIPILVLSITVITLSHFIWSSLGGQGSARRAFGIFAYYGGVIIVLSPIVGSLIVAIFRLVGLHSPGLYENVWRSMVTITPIPLNDALLAAIPMAIVFIVLSAVSKWFAPGREAFRQMHGLSRARSFAAQVLYGVAWFLVLGILVLLYPQFIQFALSYR